jgi:Tol biopolymer transport system component
MFDLAPRFSPDGRRIVFARYITDPGRSALFTVRVDGSWASGKLASDPCITGTLEA